jgi:hypothetical protein
MVPYANFNLLKFPDKAQAVAKIVKAILLSTITASKLRPVAASLACFPVTCSNRRTIWSQ